MDRYFDVENTLLGLKQLKILDLGNTWSGYEGNSQDLNTKEMLEKVVRALPKLEMIIYPLNKPILILNANSTLPTRSVDDEASEFKALMMKERNLLIITPPICLFSNFSVFELYGKKYGFTYSEYVRIRN